MIIPNGMYYTHEDTETVARWTGGIYIELGAFERSGDGYAWHGHDVINAQRGDGESGASIPFTFDALRAAVTEYLGPEVFDNDVDAIDYYGRRGNSDAPGCRYGLRVEQWAPVAYALAEVFADSTSEPIGRDQLVAAAGMVVNADDLDAFWTVWNGRHAVTAGMEEIFEPDVLVEAGVDLEGE